MTEELADLAEICPLGELSFASRESFGGKAAALGEMKRHGLPVLDGVALAATLFDQAKHRLDLSDATNNSSPSADSDLQDLSIRVIKALQNQQVTGRLIVRSSATAEDSSLTSFAGQFASVEDVDPQTGLADALLRVWQSAFAPHATAYARARKVTSPPRMAIVIQAMRSFDVAGIAFSRHPLTHTRSWALVEYLDAPPSRIVGGEVTPYRARVRLHDGHTLVETTDIAARRLLGDRATDLAQLIQTIRSLFRCEVDIEWGSVGTTIYILQARPATA